MVESNFHLAIEIGTCLLTVVLLAISLSKLCKKNKDELDEQLLEIDKRTDNYGEYKNTALQDANTNLNFNKTLQWNYIYYVVLLYAAILAINREYGIAFPAELLLTIASDLVFLVGLYLTVEIQFQIRRERLSAIAVQLTMNPNEYTEGQLQKSKNEAICLFSHPHISLTVIGTVVVGYVLCLYLIMSQ